MSLQELTIFPWLCSLIRFLIGCPRVFSVHVDAMSVGKNYKACTSARLVSYSRLVHSFCCYSAPVLMGEEGQNMLFCWESRTTQSFRPLFTCELMYGSWLYCTHLPPHPSLSSPFPSPAHQGPIRALAHSPSAPAFITCGDDCRVRFFCAREQTWHQCSIKSVSVHLFCTLIQLASHTPAERCLLMGYI